MTFGYRVADWPLFKAGFWNEMKMAISAFAVGLFSGMLLGGIGMYACEYVSTFVTV